jgi:hypothetical protein
MNANIGWAERQRNRAVLQFHPDRFLINRLQKSGSQLIRHLHCRAAKGIGLVLQKKFAVIRIHSHSFAFIRGYSRSFDASIAARVNGACWIMAPAAW